MTTRITILTDTVSELRALLAADGRVHPRLPAGLRESDGDLEFLVPAARDFGPSVRTFLVPQGLSGMTHHYWRAHPSGAVRELRADLALARGRGCSAALLRNGRVSAIHEVFLAGPRLERWIPAMPAPPFDGDVPAEGRYSRYAGALGGEAVHGRLTRLRAGMVGASRLGSNLAMALARAGISGLALIDPDVLELHALDAVECAPQDVGLPKVEAVARYLRTAAPELSVVTVPLPVQRRESWRALAAGDLIVSAPDRGDARLWAAVVACAYLRPHLDVGTGVFRAGGQVVAGADVRLIAPGDGCLLCRGGLDLERRFDRDWRRERAGSLRSLNQVAVGQAILLLERFVAGELGRSAWSRLLVAPDGLVTSEPMGLGEARGCALCDAVRGCGDAAYADGARSLG